MPTPPPQPPRWTSPAWLWLPVLLAAAALAWHGPIPQWPDYHRFADTRAWLGIPHAADVLSNLPFAWAGVWGLWRCRRVGGAPASAAWAAFALAIACTALGSSVYHWRPDDPSLVFDRLPIAWACAALSCAFLAERVDPRWAGTRPLAAALALGSAAVAWWWHTGRLGGGDLRPYVFVQFLPMLLIPAAALLRLPPRAPGALRAGDWAVALGLYAAAKAGELADAAVLGLLGVVSGHTLKHLLAAAAAAWLLGAATRLGGRGATGRAGVRSGSRR